jgi:ketosteroid isomerase-like protein
MSTPAFSDADAAAVRANIEEYRLTALAGQWDAWGATLTADVIALPPNQAPLIGREAAVAFGKAFPKLTSFTVTVDEVTGQGDLAYTRGTYAFTATTPDGASMNDGGSFLEIHRRQADGSWPYYRWIWHSDSPPSAGPATT